MSIVETEDAGLYAIGDRTATGWRGASPRWSTASPGTDRRTPNDFRFLKSVTQPHARRSPCPAPATSTTAPAATISAATAYPDLGKFWADLVAAYHQEIRSLADVGCTYLQIDETSLVKLGDPRVRELLKERGDDWRDLLKTYIDAVNAVAAGAPPGMTVGVHICRSQDPSWQADVGYDPIAEPLFNDMKVDIYFLEYDNARSGGFEPLRAVPPGKIVVLGLVATKVAELETADSLKRRIEEASQFIKLDQLALSPQCGFSTSATEHIGVDEAMERAKLARIVEVSRAVWED